MPHCKVDLSYPPLGRQIERLKKKFPKVEADLQSVVAGIQADYTSAKYHAVRIPMRGHGDGTYDVWKYDVPSADLKRHARECFRLVCVCIELTATPKTLIGLIVYFKSEREDISPKEIAAEVREAKLFAAQTKTASA